VLRSLEQLHQQVRDSLQELLAWSQDSEQVFLDHEKQLWSRLLILGRLLVLVFLAARDQRGCRDSQIQLDEQTYHRRKKKQAPISKINESRRRITQPFHLARGPTKIPHAG
jgi:hypothetical protein